MALVRQRPSIGALERAIVWVAAASPILIGASMFLSIDAAALISDVLSDATLERTPAYTAALRTTGSYVFVFGCLLATATRDLPRHAALVTVAAALFAGRSLQRAVYASTLENAYTVDPSRNVLNVAYLAAVAAALLWVRLRVRGALKEQHT
jgi:hypothetical protein